MTKQDSHHSDKHISCFSCRKQKGDGNMPSDLLFMKTIQLWGHRNDGKGDVDPIMAGRK
jgi:hypothetical protein